MNAQPYYLSARYMPGGFCLPPPHKMRSYTTAGDIRMGDMMDRRRTFGNVYTQPMLFPIPDEQAAPAETYVGNWTGWHYDPAAMQAQRRLVYMRDSRKPVVERALDPSLLTA